LLTGVAFCLVGVGHEDLDWVQVSSSQPRSPHDFVRFLRPPVAEVALTAQFDGPVADLAVIGTFAEKVRGQFPHQTQQPPAEAIEPETFDQPPGGAPIQIPLRTPMPMPRIWFESKNQERLIQLQSDRLSVNWRLMNNDPTRYPHYSKLRGMFKTQLNRLSKIVDERGGALRIRACEVLYVNPIEPLGKSESGAHPDLATIINRVSGPPKQAFLGQPEDCLFQARWRIPGENDGPIGRLYLAAAPALSEDNKSIYIVQMTGRTIPRTPQINATMDALDLGHKWVVKGFADVTTRQMHKLWRREK
jgi:uncharacterized protein (TIGR04255 family)